MATTIVMSGDSIGQLRADVRRVHGPGARIVGAQKVTVGGIGGLLARKHYEVTVEVPDPTVDAPVARVTITPPASRAGIAALLADADAADGWDAGATAAPAASSVAGPARAAARVVPVADSPEIASARDAVAARVVRDDFDEVLAGGSAASRAAAPAADRAVSPRRAARAAAAAAAGAPDDGVVSGHADVSTRTGAFADIMDDLTFNGIAAEPAPVAHPEIEEARPGPLRNAAEFLAAAAASSSPSRLADAAASGDLPVAPSVLRGAGDLVVVVGRPGDAFRVAAQMASSFGLRSVDVSDRRSAILARATGVHEGASVVTALAWDDAAPEALRSIGADQLWVAVDVGRKHDDTSRWVEAVGAVQPVAAVAVVGEDDTATPGTVHLLGVPVGWRER